MPVNATASDWKTSLLNDWANDIQTKDPDFAEKLRRLNKLLGEMFRGIQNNFQIINTGNIYIDNTTLFQDQIEVEDQITKAIAGNVLTIGHRAALTQYATFNLTTHLASYNSGTHVLTLTAKAQTFDENGHFRGYTTGSVITIDFDDFTSTGLDELEADEVWIDFSNPTISHIGPSVTTAFNYSVSGGNRWIQGSGSFPFDAKGHANDTDGATASLSHADPDEGGSAGGPRIASFNNSDTCSEIQFDSKGHVIKITKLNSGTTTVVWFDGR